LPDERDQIAEQLRAWVADPAIDVILTTGGTGLTGRDVTVEAHRDVYEKEIEAFATVFTMVSMQKIGTSAVQSRATGGVANGTYLFRAARVLGGLQGCVGRDPEMAARLPPPALQLRRDPAPARRTSATEVTSRACHRGACALDVAFAGPTYCVQPQSESVEPCDSSAAP
jgi:hypothetical protein